MVEHPSGQNRKFVVHTGENVSEVEGVETLALLLDVHVTDIPLVKLWKYRCGEIVVYEKDPAEDT